MKHKEYYLGLDMGTSTVGWAITDTEYNLIRKKGKDLWGIREFEEASTAAERRSFRVSRRRRQREQVRNNLVRSYFAEAIVDVDPEFFHRLDNSKYHLEDKDPEVRTPNGVFNDKDYQDKDYYKEYPTIFHLRKELIDNKNSPYDVRLVYLAVSNMFKHRGHFLNSGLSDEDDTISIDLAYSNFVSAAIDITGEVFDDSEDEELKRILSDRKLSKTQKTEELMRLLKVEKKQKKKAEFCKAICGRSFDVKKIFDDIDSEEKLTFSFAAFEEDAEEKLIKAVGDERYRLFSAMKAVYDAGLLADILGDNEYLSYARVASYEKHKSDLRLLKKCIKEYGTYEQYEKMFRSKEPGSYSAYVNSVNCGDVHRREMKSRKRADFYDFVKKQINAFPDSEEKQYILAEIDRESFMPKQLTASNGVIPNQVHARELKAIIGNASEYLPFLDETDDSGLTTAERILRLFSFQIPYYVGPVTERSEKDGGNGWVVRKEEGAVLPWNIDEKIDMEATRKRFISKLIRECTYLSGEKVLPKSSLLYEKYCVLNEINNIKVDDEKIPVDLKQDIFNELFKTGKKVTRNQLFEYLKRRGYIREKEQLSGIDNSINNSLSSYGKCKAVLGDAIDTDSGRAVAEDIIYLASIYGESKKFLKNQIKKKYPELTDKQIDRFAGIKFKDWGRLSKGFLEMEGIEKGTGEVRTIIGALWDTNYNLMELLTDELFTYRETLKEKKQTLVSSLSDITPDVLDEFYFSAPVKKMINQTVKIIKEAEALLGCPPARIFVEVTRSDEQKGDLGRKESRKKQLIDLYKTIKDESRDWAALIEHEDSTSRLRSKKMYLYITQMGKDMYTGKPIDIDDLFNDNLYDIDHIYPRHFVKDDSIHNNLVLVSKPENAHKSDEYPLSQTIRNNPVVSSHWKYLKDKGLITEEKYHRLISNKAFTDDQKADFIARQLVETGQGTKAVADFLKQALPETTVVYSKASNVSDFRQRFKIYKSRLVNDFHHANDAYLNVVVGNVYYTKFTQNPRNYIKSEYLRDEDNKEYNLSRMFDRDVVRNGQTAWVACKDGERGTIATVKKVISRNTPMMTRQSFCGHGGIANQTICSKEKAKGDGYIPLKTTKDGKMNDVTKYGGFAKASVAYFCLVEYANEGKRARALETVPVFLADAIEKDPALLQNYLTKKLEVENLSVRIDKILLQSLIKINGFYVHLSGKTGDRIAVRNAVNMCLENKWIRYIHDLEKYSMNGFLSDVIDRESNMQLYVELLSKNSEGIYSRRPNPIGSKLVEGKNAFGSLSVEEQCLLLLQILRISAIGADSQADLRKIGGVKQAGVMTISKNISNYDQCELIDCSPMGASVSKMNLLEI